MGDITVRQGAESDIAAVYKLVCELATFEKLDHRMTNSLEQMKKDGSGEHPLFEFLVAESGNEIVATAIYFYRYSTFQGKRLYLEDIIVTESHRMMGIGKKLFDKVIGVANDRECTGLNWLVLDWNNPAISFYKAYNAEFDNEWVVASIDAKHFSGILKREENR